MRSFGALAAAAVVAMLLQTTVLPSLPWLPVVPDLLLVLAVYVGMRHPGGVGACGAFLLGCFLDTFSGTIVGVHAVAFTAVFLGASLVGRHLWMDSGLPLMAIVFFGACLGKLAAVGVASLVAERAPVWQHVMRYGLLEAAAAAVVAPLVFASVASLKRVVGLG